MSYIAVNQQRSNSPASSVVHKRSVSGSSPRPQRREPSASPHASLSHSPAAERRARNPSATKANGHNNRLPQDGIRNSNHKTKPSSNSDFLLDQNGSERSKQPTTATTKLNKTPQRNQDTRSQTPRNSAGSTSPKQPIRFPEASTNTNTNTDTNRKRRSKRVSSARQELLIGEMEDDIQDSLPGQKHVSLQRSRSSVTPQRQRRLSAPDLRLQQLNMPLEYPDVTPPNQGKGNLYAGATFQNSPAASALPMPTFSNRSSAKESLTTSHPTEASSLPTPTFHSPFNRGPSRTFSHEALNTTGTPSPRRFLENDQDLFPMDDDPRVKDEELRKKSRDLLSLLTGARTPPQFSPPMMGPPTMPHVPTTVPPSSVHDEQTMLAQISQDLKHMLNISGSGRM